MRSLGLWILLLCSIPSIAQNCSYTLSGKVIDSHDDTPLVGATIIVAGLEKAVQTDLNGSYSITSLCEDSYSFQVSHPNCITKGFTLTVSGDTNRNFRLEHHLEELNEITLEGRVYEKQTETVLENRIREDELERYSNKSLGDVLNTISGVSSLNTGNTVVKPLINGLHSSRVVIINNGVRMEDQEWGAEHAPNLDINTAGSISVIKGANALQYSGDAVGGVVISEAPKAPLLDSLYGKTILSAASNGRGSSITSQLTKSYGNGWYGTIQGTLKRFGDFEAPDYVLSNTGIFERNASLRLGYNQIDYGLEGYYSLFKNEIGILRASHLGGAADQVRAINSDRPLIIEDFTYSIDAPKQDVTHQLARVKGFKKFEGLGRLDVQYDFQQNKRLEFDIRRGDDSDKASLDLTLNTHTLLVDLDTELFESIDFQTGVMGRYKENIANPNTGVRRLIPDYEQYQAGIYGIASYSLQENWLFEVGGRFDYTFMDVFKFYRTSFWEERNYDELFPELVIEELDNQLLTNPQLTYNNFSGTVGTSYSFGDDYKLLLNYSLASRAPNPSELFSEGLHHSASRIELGDLRFNSEVAHKVSATFQRDHDTFSFAMNPYVNTIEDFIIIEPIDIQQTVRGNFQVWEYRQTQAQLVGVDFDAQYAFAPNFQWNNQFSLVKGYDRTRDEPLINMPPISLKNEVVYQNTELNNLRLSLQSDYAFRQNEFPDNNFEVFLPTTETNEVVDVSTPPDAYHLLHFRSSMDFDINMLSVLNVGLQIDNIFNTEYRNYLNRLRYYADDLGRNISIQLKLNY